MAEMLEQLTDPENYLIHGMAVNDLCIEVMWHFFCTQIKRDLKSDWKEEIKKQQKKKGFQKDIPWQLKRIGGKPPEKWDITVLFYAIVNNPKQRIGKATTQYKILDALVCIRNDHIGHIRRGMKKEEYDCMVSESEELYKQLLKEDAESYIRRLKQIENDVIDNPADQKHKLEAMKDQLDHCLTQLYTEPDAMLDRWWEEATKQAMQGQHILNDIKLQNNDEHLCIEVDTLRDVIEDLFPFHMWKLWEDFGKECQLQDVEISQIKEQRRGPFPLGINTYEEEFCEMVGILMSHEDRFIFSKENIYRTLEKVYPDYADEFKKRYFK